MAIHVDNVITYVVSCSSVSVPNDIEEQRHSICTRIYLQEQWPTYIQGIDLAVIIPSGI